MAKFLKTVVNVVLSILPQICTILYSTAIVIVVISLNPSVTWNTYSDDDYYGSKIQFSHTLWGHFDAGVIEGNKAALGGTNTYFAILNEHTEKIDIFKGPVIDKLYMAIGTVGGAALFLLVGISVHAVTKQKLFVIILEIISVGSGIAGGYFKLSAKTAYKNGIPDSLSTNGKQMLDSEKLEMALGYQLALYGAIISIGSSALLMLSLGFYIPFGDGKWIWQKKTDVTPENKAWDETKKTPTENVKTATTKTNVVSIKNT